MFCPNCGKDCGEFRFCPECGTQMENIVIKKEQRDSCQNEAITEERPKDRETEKTTVELPCGIYKGATSFLALYEKECVVNNQVSLFKTVETRIPYDKLKTVIYVRGTAGFSHLLFRWEGNEDLPIPEVQRFRKDPTTVTVYQKTRMLFSGTYNDVKIKDISVDTLIYHIYYALKTVAPETAVFKANIQEQNAKQVKELASKTDTSLYFSKYAPFREQAVEEMCRRTGAFRIIAAELVDQLFDKRQKEIYEEDAKVAVQDLNLLVEERKKRVEMAEEEQRKEADQRRLLYALEDDD